MTRSRDVADTQDNIGGAVAPFVAGKNKIINGDFAINQRNFTSVTTDITYTFDRFRLQTLDGTVTATPQTFTPGAAPVAGYEGGNFAQIAVTGQTNIAASAQYNQAIEDVRIFAGQTVTASFWAKATSGTPKIAVELRQIFGTGGSSVVNIYAGQVTLSTSWARYSVSVAVPSISGKTIGTGSSLTLNLWASAGSNFDARTGTLGIQNNTFQFWGVQLEAGNVATPFTTASGSIGGELALCQRYYWRIYNPYTGVNNALPFVGTVTAGNQVWVQLNHPIKMRTTPTALDYANIGFYVFRTGGNYASGTWTLNTSSPDASGLIYTTSSGLTVNDAGIINQTVNGTNVAYFGLTAEL